MGELLESVIRKLCPAHESGGPGKTTCCLKCPHMVLNARLAIMAVKESIIGQALTEADNALGSLRLCDEVEAQNLCYLAENTNWSALRQLREAAEL